MFVGAGSSPTTVAPRPRQRLGQEAAAAADIERGEPLERSRLARVAAESPAGFVADVLQAERVQPVERPHRPVRIPPVAGEPVEARALVRVYGAAGGHAPSCRDRPSTASAGRLLYGRKPPEPSHA